MSEHGTSSNPSPNLQVQSDLNRAGFLKTELSLAFTFSNIAATKYDGGNRTSAEVSMGNSEKAYSTVIRFLSDPKHSKHLTAEETRDMRTELELLRGRLDGLLRRFKQ
jgi:hypothetical protein